jgi:hypothetical protein
MALHDTLLCSLPLIFLGIALPYLSEKALPYFYRQSVELIGYV